MITLLLKNLEMIRLLLKKRSDLGLSSLLRPFGQETSVCNFTTDTIHVIGSTLLKITIFFNCHYIVKHTLDILNIIIICI